MLFQLLQGGRLEDRKPDVRRPDTGLEEDAARMGQALEEPGEVPTDLVRLEAKKVTGSAELVEKGVRHVRDRPSAAPRGRRRMIVDCISDRMPGSP